MPRAISASMTKNTGKSKGRITVSRVNAGSKKRVIKVTKKK